MKRYIAGRCFLLYRRTIPVLVMLLLLASCSHPNSLTQVNQPEPDSTGSDTAQETHPSLFQVDATADAVWVAGDGGIWESVDQGATWMQKYRTAHSVDFLQFTDDQHGWAADYVSETQENTLIATTDGGNTWEVVAKLPDGAANFQFVSTTSGYAVQTKQRKRVLIHSANGGRTWEPVNTPVEVWKSCWSTPEAGWIMGEDNSVLYTSDGGTTWSSVGAVPKWYSSSGTYGYEAEEIGDVLCAADSSLFLVVVYAKGAGTGLWALYKVRPDTGWVPIAHNFPGRKTQNRVLVRGGILSSPDTDHIFMAGVTLDWLGIEGTLDGTTEWQAGFIDSKTLTRTDAKTDTSLPGNPVDLHFISPTTGWMIVYDWATKKYSLLLTTDGGSTWESKASS